MESHSGENLQEQLLKLKLEDGPPTSSLAWLRLLVHLENEKQLAQGSNSFNCQVIENKDVNSFLGQLTTMTPPADESLRMQLIIANRRSLHGA